MDGWEGMWVDGQMDGWEDGWVGGRVSGWMDKWEGGWLDGQMDGMVGRWMKILVRKIVPEGDTFPARIYKAEHVI